MPNRIMRRACWKTCICPCRATPDCAASQRSRSDAAEMKPRLGRLLCANGWVEPVGRGRSERTTTAQQVLARRAMVALAEQERQQQPGDLVSPAHTSA